MASLIIVFFYNSSLLPISEDKQTTAYSTNWLIH